MGASMAKVSTDSQCPYIQFTRAQWQAYRCDMPLTLSADEVAALQGQNDPISLQEVEDIYLPLSRLLRLYVNASRELYRVSSDFLGHPEPKVPYIIAVSGSVAVGKSTTTRVLQALLSRWPEQPKVAAFSTDGFLWPNQVLQANQLMIKKGFPESFNLVGLIECLRALKAGQAQVSVPVYSHHLYDILPGECYTMDQPDIVIVEGLNVLQTANNSPNPRWRVFASDFFDFTVYVDAPTALIKAWYIERFMQYRSKARQDPSAYFHQFAALGEAEAQQFASQIWDTINAANLIANILPCKERAALILKKAEHHQITDVWLRKL